MLTEQQYKLFQTFGFLILSKLFSQEELQTIETEFEHGLKKAYFDNPFDGTCRHWTTMMGAETPFFAHLLEDSRFCQVAEQIYGEDGYLAQFLIEIGDNKHLRYNYGALRRE